jgi:cell division septum initiation protein DivIVA
VIELCAELAGLRAAYATVLELLDKAEAEVARLRELGEAILHKLDEADREVASVKDDRDRWRRAWLQAPSTGGTMRAQAAEAEVVALTKRAEAAEVLIQDNLLQTARIACSQEGCVKKLETEVARLRVVEGQLRARLEAYEEPEEGK